MRNYFEELPMNFAMAAELIDSVSEAIQNGDTDTTGEAALDAWEALEDCKAALEETMPEAVSFIEHLQEGITHAVCSAHADAEANTETSLDTLDLASYRCLGMSRACAEDDWPEYIDALNNTIPKFDRANSLLTELKARLMDWWPEDEYLDTVEDVMSANDAVHVCLLQNGDPDDVSDGIPASLDAAIKTRELVQMLDQFETDASDSGFDPDIRDYLREGFWLAIKEQLQAAASLIPTDLDAEDSDRLFDLIS